MVAAVPVRSVTLLAWSGVWECPGREKEVSGRAQGVCMGFTLTNLENIISHLNHFCKYGGSCASYGSCAGEKYDTTSMVRDVRMH